jgi:hypothetical protein
MKSEMRPVGLVKDNRHPALVRQSHEAPDIAGDAVIGGMNEKDRSRTWGFVQRALQRRR